MVRDVVSVSVVLGLVFTGLAGPEKVALSLDYGTSEEWTYSMEYQSACRFIEKGSTSTKKTTVNCLLDGEVGENKEAIEFEVESLSVSSELYDEATKESMMKKLTEAPYRLPLQDGHPSVAGLGDLSSKGLPEWNLYVQFAKLLPVVPEQPSKKGFTWERSGRFVVHTPRGAVPCEVYRQFKVDRISADKDTAFISWQFKYSALEKTEDTAALLKYVPVAGKGKGTAAIHIDEGYIVSATMNFETPVAKVDKAKVSWEESASIRRVSSN
jgi:hypothetical protein